MYLIAITKQLRVSKLVFYDYKVRPSLQMSVIYGLRYPVKYNLFLNLASTFPVDFDYDTIKKAGNQSQYAALNVENKKLKWENGLL